MYWYGFTENSVPFIKGLEPCGVPAGARVSLTTTAMAAAYGTDQGQKSSKSLLSLGSHATVLPSAESG